MVKNTALTVRLPAWLKARLEARAETEHRSLSAQVVADLERLSDELTVGTGGEGRFLGLYSGTAVPSEADLAEVRAQIWGRLARRDEA